MTTRDDCPRGLTRLRRAGLPGLGLLALLLAGCATPPPATVPADAAPPQWHATLPHGGDAVALGRWWQGFDDPLLPVLIDTAQQRNPTLAQAAGMSPHALVRAFRAATGLTPHAYQLNLRINAARTLLRAGHAPAVVAQDLGFYDQSHFQNAFRQRVAATPGNYRR